jgi:hypothetical protein
LSTLTDYASLRTRNVDVGIAPPNTEFNRAKSGIKFLEYSAAGIPGVYSGVTPYLGLVHEGHTGLLANSLEAWEHDLERLIGEPLLRESIRRQAQDAAYSRWSLSRHSTLWPDVVTKALRVPRRAPQSQSGQSQLMFSLARQVNNWQGALQRELEASQAREAALSDTHVQLQEARAARQSQEDELVDLRKQVDGLELRAARVPMLEMALADNEREVDDLRASIQRKDADLTSRVGEIGEARGVIAEREHALVESQRHVEQEMLMVKALSDELLALKGSTAYVVMRIMWRVRLALAPHGSGRERLLQRGMAVLRRARQGRRAEEGSHIVARPPTARRALASLYRVGRPIARALLPERWRLRLGARAREALGPQADMAQPLPMRRLLEAETAGVFGAPQANDVCVSGSSNGTPPPGRSAGHEVCRSRVSGFTLPIP